MITDVVGQKYRQGTAKMSCLGTMISGISIWKTGRLGLPQRLGLESIGGIFTHVCVLGFCTAWCSQVSQTPYVVGQGSKSVCLKRRTQKLHGFFKPSLSFVESLNMVSTWCQLVQPRFKEKGYRSLLSCRGGVAKNLEICKPAKSTLWTVIIYIPPMCKRYVLFPKPSRRPHLFGARLRSCSFHQRGSPRCISFSWAAWVGFPSIWRPVI